MQVNDEGKDLMSTEEREVGAVSRDVYFYYFKIAGRTALLIMMVCLTVSQMTGMGGNYWLALWASSRLNNGEFMVGYLLFGKCNHNALP